MYQCNKIDKHPTVMKPVRKAPLRREHGSDRPAPVTLREEAPMHRTNVDAQSTEEDSCRMDEYFAQLHTKNTPKDAIATTPKTHGPVAQVTPYHEPDRATSPQRSPMHSISVGVPDA